LIEAGEFADEEEVVRRALEELLGDRRAALQDRFQREDIAWASAQKAGTPGPPDRLRERERFVESVQAGLADAEAGRVITNEKLDGPFGPLGTEGLKKRLRKDRPMTTIRLSVPEDVVEDLERVAAARGFSGHLPLIRAYVGQGLRRDLETLQGGGSSGRPDRGRQPTHPGEILREDVLPALRLSVSEAARQLRVARQTLQRVLSGRSAVTPEMALRLGKFCSNGPDLWLRMQQAHDLWQARERLGAELDEIPEHAAR
jgi:addiction module HigA family antidote